MTLPIQHIDSICKDHTPADVLASRERAILALDRRGLIGRFVIDTDTMSHEVHPGGKGASADLITWTVNAEETP